MIEDAGVVPEVVLYLETPPTKDELKKLISQLGISAEALVRKGEDDYKQNFKGKQLSEEQWVQAMEDFPKLIERPIVVRGQRAIIGRPPEAVKSLL